MTRCNIVLFFLLWLPLQSAVPQNACEEHTFPANAVDSHGQQILGLTTEQFRAVLQGQPVKVMSANFKSGPQRIVVLIDLSDSVWVDSKERELVKLVAQDVVSAGPPQAQLALATFSSEFKTIVGLGQDRETVREGILRLSPKIKTSSTPLSSGGTAMNDAILEAANMFGNPQPGDVIYAITDGFDNGSHSSSGKVLQYLEQRNIRLFVSAIDNPDWMPYSRYTGGPESVGKFAKETGGYYIILGTDRPRKSAPGTSTNALHQLYALMASFYLLDVVVPKDQDKPRELKLVVTDPNGNKKKDAIVLYPQKVFPCARAR